ncbi:beta strand repeat-containing protein [Microbacterium aurugineum]
MSLPFWAKAGAKMLDKRSYDRRGPVRAVAAVLGTALVIAMLIFAQAQSAQAVTHLYLIDSLSAVGSDTDVGDGVCMTAAGTCTLRAALEQANALPPGDTVTIAPAEDVDASTPGVQDSGTIVGSGSGAANFMFVGNLTPLGDGGAYFMATRPLMVDFQNRLGIASLNDANGATAVFVNGPGVTLRNFSNIRSNETAMVVGAAGAGALIEDGSCTDPGSINLERCLWLADGAHGVTVRNVQMGSTWSGGGSAVRLAVGAMVNNLTLDRVRFYDPDNEAYDGFQGQSWGHLDNLTVIGSTFEGFRSGRNALDFRNLILTNAQITGNTFIRNNSGATPSIAINRSGTENLIAGNVFANSAAENTSNAIAFSGMAVAAAVESGWQVRDNSFDGYRAASVTMASGSGILPVFHNLFGPLSFGGSAPANETNAAALVNNGTATANQGIVTWFPSAVSTDPLTCTLTVDVSPPVTTPTPEIPVRVDVYYTAASQAEVFLGSQSGLTTASPITVPYTIGEGFIRVQTQAANGSTSQYSRTIAQTEPDSCAPTVTVEQAVTQTDPTSIRSLSFTAQFSESIPGGLDPAVVSTAGSTAPGVHVTDVTPVSDRVFRITAQADASGLIVVSLPEGAAMDAAGNESLASTSVDNEVTYMSPLSLAPDTVTVTEGEPGATFSVSSTLGATAPILVTSTSNAVQWATVAPGTLTIPTTAAAGDVTVTAVDDTVANGTRNTTVAATVASADPNFDGLLLDPVAVTILDNDLADPGLSTLTISPGPRVADGADAHTVTAIARNAGGQTVENALVTFTAEAGAQLSASSCVTAPEGTCAVTVASTLADSFQIDALIAGTVEPSTSPVTATFVPGPPDLTTSTIMSSALTLPVGGETSATITVTLFDANGNPVGVGGNTVEITTDAGAVSATTDNGDGTYTATLTSPVAAGTATVGYTLDAAPGERTVVINFVAGEPSASTSSIEAAPTTVAADGVATSTVTVELVDGYGNPVGTGGAAVLVNTTAGTLSGVTDHGDGTYTATLTAPSTTGTATLTFSVNGDTATAEATVDFVPGAADLATSSIQAVPTTITADGLAQSAITVTLRDSAGNPATGGGEPVTVTTTNGVIGTTLDNDDGTYTAVLTSATLPGSATVGFTLGGTPGAATGLVSFVPGAPDGGASTVAAAPGTIVADGVSTATVTVTVRDAQGNVLTDGGEAVVIQASAGAVSATTDNLDGTYTATLTSSTVAGSATVSFLLDGHFSPNTAPVAFIPGPADPAQATITASPSSVAADGLTTSLVIVTLFDSQGNAVTSGADTVDLGTTLGSFGSGTVDGGEYRAFLSSSVAGTATVSFAVDGATSPANAMVDFVAGAADPTESTISATPINVVANGVDESTVTVTVRDSGGNPVLSGTVVTMSSSVGSLSEPQDNGDGTWTAALSSVAAGASTVSFTVDGTSSANNAQVEFLPGPVDPSVSHLNVTPLSVTADGVASTTAMVTLLDEQSNAVGVGGANVNILSSLGVVDPVIDNGDGTYSATISSTTVGSAAVGFTIDGVPGTATVMVEFVPGAADPDSSTIVAVPTTVTADGVAASTLTVTLRDAQGNPVGIGGDTVLITSDLGTPSSVTDNSDGTYSATISSTTVGSAAVGFTIDGVPGTATVMVEFVPGAADPDSSTIVAAPSLVLADGVTAATVTVTLRDAQGNPVGTGGDTVLITSDLGTPSAVTDNSDGTYTATLTSTVAGTATVGFEIDGAPGAATTAVQFTAGPADPATSTISAAPSLVLADGVTAATVTVTLRDAQGNPVGTGGDTVLITSDLGTPSSVTDNSDGTYTATLTSTVAGTATVGFEIDGAPGAATTTVVFAPGPADPATSTIEAAPPTITADGISASTVTVTLRDAQGNPVGTGGDTVTLTTDRGTVTTPVNNGDGTYAGALTSTVTGSATVGFTIDGVPGTATVMVEFVPGAADPDSSTIVAAPSLVLADGVTAATVTVTLRDAQGNPVGTGGDTVLITSDLGTPSSVTDNSDGTYTATLTSTVAGTATVGFEIDGAPGAATTAVQFTAGPADPATSTISADPATIVADGTAASTVTVLVTDAQGNPVTSGTSVVITSDLGIMAGLTDNGGGSWTATLTGTVLGTATVGFSVGV